MTAFPEVSAPGAPTTTTAGARVDWATVPKVNLLPPEILQSRRMAGVKRVLAGVVVVTLAACVGGVVWAQGGVGAAQDELDAVQARGASLRAQQAKYAQVPPTLAVIDATATAREQAMAQDIPWYGLLSDLALTTPKGVKLDTLSVTLDAATVAAPAAAAAAAPGTDPLTPAGIGSVSFTGEAAHFPDVAAWLESVATLHGLDGSTLQSATRAAGSGGLVSFSSTIKVTSKALTHRFDRKAH
jgi:Tfp pilus assembly protein PilN